jgi:nucleotide-binding universal stress UspA family protein
MQITRILMPTDFSSCAHGALAHALLLARLHQAELHLLHVEELHENDPEHNDHTFPQHEEILARVMESAKGEMGKILPPSGSLQIIERQSRALAAAPEIVRYAEKEGMDLIVIGTHGRRGIRRLILGSVTDEVVRTAHCPVLTLHTATGSPPPRRPDPILVPIDFSQRSRSSLETAKALAEVYGSGLELVHVFQRPVYPDVYPGLAGPAAQYTFPQLNVELSDALKDWAGEEDGISSTVLEGQPAYSIAKHAESVGAGLIVLATHGLGGLPHFLLGSVSEQVVRRAECPVLILRSEAEKA